MTDGPPPPPDRPSDDLVGSVLAGRYRIERRLGDGAMGTVYLGEHLRFGRLDAIKVLREGMARDSEATERFLRGARNASRINHPHVCTVYDFGDTDDGKQFLAMEFVDGEPLADVLEAEGRLEAARAVEIVRQIGDALDAAHELGIVHRDLKPGNVMLARGRDGADQVKVVDFDIAKGSADGEGAEVTRTGFVVGTPEYMSPEQLIGDPLDGRSDVYSLALVFVRILTGRLPVRAESTQDLMVERLTQEPLPLREIAPDLGLPAGVQAALDHALQRRRDDRPATAGAFTAALVRGLADEAAPASAPRRPPPPTDTPATAPDGDAAAAPSAPRGPTGVPATTVGAIPPSGTAPPGPRPTPPALRRFGPWIAGGLVVVAAGFGITRMLGDDGAPAGPATETPPTTPPGAVADAPDEPGSDDPAATDPADGPPGSTDVSATDDPAPADPSTDDPPADDPAPQSSDDPTPPDPGPAPVPTDVEDLLFRQLDRLTDAPGTATWSVARDSARWAWNESRLPSSVRALAAYTAASAFEAEGRLDDALTWARRAVELAPSNRGFRTLLDRLGGALP